MRNIRIIAIIMASLLFCDFAGACIFKKKTKEEKKLSAYEKLFKDKDVTVAGGCFYLYMVEDKILAEIPKKELSSTFALDGCIENTSDGSWGVAGFSIPGEILFNFELRDSVLLMRRQGLGRMIFSEQESREAFEKSAILPVVESFRVKAYNKDSSSFIADITKLVKSDLKELKPIDNHSEASMEGSISLNLNRIDDKSMISGIGSRDSNSVYILRTDTYEKSQKFMGLNIVGGDGEITIETRWTISKIKTNGFKPKKARSDLGIKAIKLKKFDKSDRGSQDVFFALKWNIPENAPITFYVDTLFPERMSGAIKEGISKWNSVLAACTGIAECIKVKDFERGDFDSKEHSCIIYEPTESEEIHDNIFFDPLTGEIKKAVIYVPFNVLRGIQSNLFFQLGHADKTVRTTNCRNEMAYNALSAAITRRMGFCLGLDSNMASSSCVPSDSLRSPSFTQKYGLSGSIMDVLPYNYFAREGDKERGVKLIHDRPGIYDEKMIEWLYSDRNEEDENKLISQIMSNPMCLYVREQKQIGLDPRTCPYDLGDDPVVSFKTQLESAKIVIDSILPMIKEEDRDYSFRIAQNTPLVYNVVYRLMDLCKYVGGVYINEKKDGSPGVSQEVVPPDLQRQVLLTLLETTEDLSFLDNKDMYKDILHIQSRGGYFTNLFIDNILSATKRLEGNASSEKNLYTLSRAWDDILDYVRKKMRKGGKTAENILPLQYALTRFVIKGASIPGSSSKSSSPRGEISASTKGFYPIRKIDFGTVNSSGHVYLSKLKKLKKIYAGQIKIEKNKELKRHYIYLLKTMEKEGI